MLSVQKIEIQTVVVIIIQRGEGIQNLVGMLKLKTAYSARRMCQCQSAGKRSRTGAQCCWCMGLMLCAQEHDPISV